MPFSEPVDFERVDCPCCGITFFLPSKFLQSRQELKEVSIFCPNGDSITFSDSFDIDADSFAVAEQLREENLKLLHKIEILEARLNTEKAVRERAEKLLKSYHKKVVR